MKISDALTITMPVYERKDFFEKALLSILHQTVKCHIIVVDNCSSHNFFKETCEKYNVEYHRNESNIGLFPNWNKCMSLTRTKYSMIFQDDNILEATFVEEFIKTLNNYPNLDFYFTDFSLFDLANNNVSSHKHIYPFGYCENGMKIIEYGIRYKLGIPYAFIVNKSKFTEYYTAFHASNDWLWVYEKIKELSVFGEQKKLLRYGTHLEQDSKNINTHIHCMLSIAYIYDKVLAGYFENGSELSDMAKNNGRATLWYFLGIIPKKKAIEILSTNNIYSEFLKSKLSSEFVLRVFMLLPLFLRTFLFRSFRKIGIVGTV